MWYNNNMTNAKDNKMVFNIGETVQIWDWITADNATDPDALETHGAVGVIARHSKATDVHRGDRLGQRAADCFQIAIPNRGLVHVNTAWLRKVS
jgi:hypothetical protein